MFAKLLLQENYLALSIYVYIYQKKTIYLDTSLEYRQKLIKSEIYNQGSFSNTCNIATLSLGCNSSPFHIGRMFQLPWELGKVKSGGTILRLGKSGYYLHLH